jgi:hypothetical protein
VKPAQEWDLHEDFKGEVEYTTRLLFSPLHSAPGLYVYIYLFLHRIVNFVNVSHLTLYFPTNFGADCSRVYYIGLKGEYTEVRIFIFCVLFLFIYFVQW